MTRALITGFLALALMGMTSSQDDKPYSETSKSGHITSYSANKRVYETWYSGPYKFASAVRAGDFVFLSGTISGAFVGDSPIGEEEFKKDLRARFNYLETSLKAAGASFDDVVKITTYHVFDSKWVTLNKVEQVRAVADVKNEFIPAPHPAWTAIGTSELFSDRGLVEIELTAYAPLEKSKK